MSQNREMVHVDDNELAVMAQATLLLKSLADDERARVLWYLNRRFETSAPEVNDDDE